MVFCQLNYLSNIYALYIEDQQTQLMVCIRKENVADIAGAQRLYSF